MFPSDTLFRKPQRFLFHLRPDVFSMRSLQVPLVFILFIAVSIGFCLKPPYSFHNIPDDSNHNPYIAFPKKRHSALFFAVAKFAKFNYLI